MRSQKGKLEEKIAQLDLWLERGKSIDKEYQRLVQDPDHQHYRENLERIYTKKVQNNNCYSDDEDDEDSDWESVDEGDSCPDGCPQDLYEAVLQMRDKTNSLEDELRSFQREMGITKRNYEQLCAKEKQAQREIDSVESQIQAFHDRKQKALDEINTFIPMNSKQLYLYRSNNSECKDGEETDVIFCSGNLRKLYLRARELREKIDEDKATFKELRSDKKQLKSKQRETTNSIKQLEEHCNEIQMLKFGQLVDLKAFDAITDASLETVESGRSEELLKVSKQHDNEVAKAEGEITSLKTKLKDETSANTQFLTSIAELSQRAFDLSQRKDMPNKVEGTQDVDNEEDHRLKEICKKQMKEIETLKTAIHRLTRQDGKNQMH